MSSFVIGLSGAMMPGPLFTVTVSQAAARGWIVGPQVVLGHGLLELSLVLAIVYGFGQFLSQDPVIGVIGIGGGSVLLWMGGCMVRDARKVSFQAGRPQGGGSIHPVFCGLLFSLSNPYWLIWWATIGLTYIAFSMKYGKSGVAFFYTGHVLADLIWYLLVAALIYWGKRWIRDRVFQLLITFCGVLLLFFGIYFGYSGLRKFF